MPPTGAGKHNSHTYSGRPRRRCSHDRLRRSLGTWPGAEAIPSIHKQAERSSRGSSHRKVPQARALEPAGARLAMQLHVPIRLHRMRMGGRPERAPHTTLHFKIPPRAARNSATGAFTFGLNTARTMMATVRAWILHGLISPAASVRSEIVPALTCSTTQPTAARDPQRRVGAQSRRR